jgi:hypothetical protein
MDIAVNVAYKRINQNNQDPPAFLPYLAIKRVKHVASAPHVPG